MKTRVVTCLAFAILSNSVAFATDISEIVGKMSSAERQANYDGIYVLRKSDDMMTWQVVHGADDRGVWESIESLNGEARKVIRLNDEVTSIYPSRKLITISQGSHKPSLHPTLPQNLEKLSNYYEVNLLGSDRVAGRETNVLEVQPKDKYRFGYTYWLDTETGVLLRCDLLDENGDIVEQIMYTTFNNHDSVPAEAFKSSDLEGYKKKVITRKKEHPESKQWRISNLPKGFMLTHSSVHSNEGSESHHLTYSDGLASVSVFIEPIDSTSKRLTGTSSMGALHAYGQQVNDMHVTAMGEVPVATLVQMAQSMERVR